MFTAASPGAGRVLRPPAHRTRRLGGSLASIAALAISAANAARIGPASTTLHRRRLHCPTLHLPGKAPSTCITPEFCRLPRKILLNSSLDQKVIPKFQMVFRSPWWYTLWRRSTCCCFRPATNPMVKDSCLGLTWPDTILSLLYVLLFDYNIDILVIARQALKDQGRGLKPKPPGIFIVTGMFSCALTP
jgi:hypothetical protein